MLDRRIQGMNNVVFLPTHYEFKLPIILLLLQIVCFDSSLEATLFA